MQGAEEFIVGMTLYTSKPKYISYLYIDFSELAHSTNVVSLGNFCINTDYY